MQDSITSNTRTDLGGLDITELYVFLLGAKKDPHVENDLSISDGKCQVSPKLVHFFHQFQSTPKARYNLALIS